jgi:hypothetical protein
LFAKVFFQGFDLRGWGIKKVGDYKDYGYHKLKGCTFRKDYNI